MDLAAQNQDESLSMYRHVAMYHEACSAIFKCGHSGTLAPLICPHNILQV